MRYNTSLISLLFLPLCAYSQKPIALTTDLLEHTDRVVIGGYQSNVKLGELNDAIEPCQTADIRSQRPWLGWVMTGQKPNTTQRAYRIMMASSAKLLTDGTADMWDSGKVESDNSSTVVYNGTPLKPSTVYYWKVKTWDNHGIESGYSDVRSFKTAGILDNGISRYPLEKTDELPLMVNGSFNNAVFMDFGTDAFAQLVLTLTTRNTNDTVTVHLGEVCADGRVNRKPEGSQRYAMYRLPLLQGTHTYRIKLRKDKRNTTPKQNESGVDPILMPDYIGEVYPFRYCEIEGYGRPVSCGETVRQVVSYPFNDFASTFHSSDTVLNKVWQLCKHTIKATSFAGTYVDGDRERIPYEADAIINQLSHYAVDRDFSIARHSVNHLIYNPTWPTEWILQSVIMAWNDYLYTGDNRLLASTYEDLKAKTLSDLRDDNDLISTRTGKQTGEVLESIHFKGKQLRDIVDWPQKGAKGIEKADDGEADGFVFTNYNTVVNAYHYEALRLLSQTAAVLGKKDEADKYDTEADKVKTAINNLLTDKQTGLYKDGIDTDHSSLHSNMFALDFGLVTERNRNRVIDFVKSRKMGCSVYGAQFLLDALYDAGEADYALSLLNSTARRSWYNMLQIGSTITTEAWDNVFKPNQDWNHPWGAAPANIIVRKLMGIEPLTPGYATMRIKPQPSSLRTASITVPTIKGDVSVSFDNVQGKSFTLDVCIPANTTAEVWLPRLNKKYTIDGTVKRSAGNGNYIKVTIGSGTHRLSVSV